MRRGRVTIQVKTDHDAVLSAHFDTVEEALEFERIIRARFTRPPQVFPSSRSKR